jgi:hypothetical protein
VVFEFIYENLLSFLPAPTPVLSLGTILGRRDGGIGFDAVCV